MKCLVFEMIVYCFEFGGFGVRGVGIISIGVIDNLILWFDLGIGFFFIFWVVVWEYEWFCVVYCGFG